MKVNKNQVLYFFGEDTREDMADYVALLLNRLNELENSEIAKEEIELYGKTYEVDHFKLRSKDMNLPKDKRLDFDIWYNHQSSMILKIAYSRMGDWEYHLKNFD